MRKVKKVLSLALCALCIIGTISETASAETRWFRFKFTNDTDEKTYYLGADKADNEQKVHLTLLNYDIESGAVDATLSSKNKFGCKFHRVSGGADNVDVYRIHTSYFTNKAWNYQSKVHKGDTMKIRGKKDNSSTSAKTLRVYGRYTP